jgi:hypothetical protein
VAPNALTGVDIAEAQLAKVPAAAVADRSANAEQATSATDAAHARSADQATVAEQASNVFRIVATSPGAVVPSASSPGATVRSVDGNETYEVSFGRDLRSCAVTVSPYSSAEDFTVDGSAVAFGSKSNPTALTVRTFNNAGQATAKPFAVIAVC